MIIKMEKKKYQIVSNTGKVYKIATFRECAKTLDNFYQVTKFSNKGEEFVFFLLRKKDYNSKTREVAEHWFIEPFNETEHINGVITDIYGRTSTKVFHITDKECNIYFTGTRDECFEHIRTRNYQFAVYIDDETTLKHARLLNKVSKN